MSKALLFSDLHLHSHKQNIDRLQDCLQVLQWVLDQASQRKCKHIFFLGDLFHERAKIDVLNYLRAFEVLMDFALSHPEITIHMIVGNHDMYHKKRWDVNSIKPLTAIPNVEIIDEPKTLLIEGKQIDCLPHTENPLKELETLKEGRDPANLQLLFAHIAVHGASLNALYGTRADVIVEYDDEMIAVEAEKLNDWQHVFLGHFHGAQQLNEQVEYVGSPLQLSFGEVFQQKHVVILDLETYKKEYVVNDFSPRHYIIPPEDIDNYDLEKNFVRVVVDKISAEEIVAIKKGVLAKNPASVDFRQKDKQDDSDGFDIEAAKEILHKKDEMLETYMRVTGIPPGLDTKRLLEIGKQIVGANA